MICMSVELMDQQGCREWSGLIGGGAGGSLEKSGGPVDGQVSREQNWNWEDREHLS